ncbi:Uncharacterized protein ToN1_33820 [Aromatoleum petrolei]|nr:Uncharacterized protein ToN1_33820 [Aromatoleum petrolei]
MTAATVPRRGAMCSHPPVRHNAEGADWQNPLCTYLEIRCSIEYPQMRIESHDREAGIMRRKGGR